MKRVKIGILMLLFLVPLLSYAFDLKSEYDILVEESKSEMGDDSINTEEMNFEKTPINKLGRGSINLLTCWGEILAEFFNASRDKDPAVGISVGLTQGLVTSLYRGASGLYDILTFPYPPYDRPPMKPEYALQHAEDAEDSFNAKSRLFGE